MSNSIFVNESKLQQSKKFLIFTGKFQFIERNEEDRDKLLLRRDNTHRISRGYY